MSAISGPLLSQEYLRAEYARQPLTLASARVAAFRRQRLHATAIIGPATHQAAIAPAAAVPLARWLGWPLDHGAAVTGDGGCWFALTASDADDVRLLVVSGTLTESRTRMAMRAALVEGARWSMVTDGRLLRLVDAARGPARGYLEFDLDACAGDAVALGWLARLLGPGAFVSGAETSLTRLLEGSDAFGRRVCLALRGGVADALTAFTQAVARASGRRRDLAACYIDALTAVYRVLFLLFAEARLLVPMWHPAYRRGYSIDALRSRLGRGLDPTGTWATLQAIARLAHAGGTTGDLHVTAFNGRLFAPARAPLLDHLALDDVQVGRALEALSFTGTGAGRQRIAYAELGVEELGSVYENLLDLEPVASTAPQRDRSGSVRLSPSARTARKSTGTYYTPRSLADHLVAETLGPLTAGRRPEEILALRLLDPAMGSGAFLVSASRYLAAAWERSAIDHGESAPDEISDADRAATRRLIASRCLFGVDRNPMAVQLGQLSVWLATLAADRPLSFLDHHLVAGNSLVGASPVDVLARPPSGHAMRSPLPLDALFEWTDALAFVRAARQRLEAVPDDSAEVVREKDRALGSLARHGDLTRWKSACDLWCAAWTPGVERGVYHALLDRALGRAAASTPVLDAAHTTLASRATDLGCFHWPLEFPEVFLDPDGRPRADGGFDAVIGNPPWEMLRGDRYRTPNARDDGDATLRFTRDSGIYKYQGRGHANQVQLFVERALSLARPGGRVGLVVPASLLGDDGSEALRRGLLLANGVDAITVFDNRRGLFPIHRSLRFATIAVTRHARTARIRCRFGVVDPADVADGIDGSAAAPTVMLSPSLLEQISGPGLAIPHLPTPSDLRLVEMLHAAHPRLGSPAGWHVSFSRELNATDDRDCFREGRVRDGDLAVVEGRHLEPFRVDLSAATRFADPNRTRERLGSRDATDRCRLAYRDVASASNRTTLIAAVLPAGVVTVHTVFVLRERLPIRTQDALCGLLNSFAANYLVRRRVTTHVTTGIMSALPVPKQASWSDELADIAAALRETDDPVLSARGQALAAEAYGLSVEDLRHVLSTFPLVESETRDAVLEAFLSRTPPRSWQ